MPSVSKKQQRFMGAELNRKRHGQSTQTGMSEKQLSEFAGSVHIHGGSMHEVVTMGEPTEVRQIAPGIGGACKYGQDWEPMKFKESPFWGLEPETQSEDLIEYGNVYQPGQREQE